MKLLAESNTKIDDITIYLNLFKLYKSFLLLISDQPDMGIGNVTLSSPSVIEGIKSPTASYSLFGMNTKLLSTIIAEKATSILKAPVLLLLFLKNKTSDEAIIKPLMKFLNDNLEKISEKVK
ncbi:MAG: hypothetical protein ACFE9S_10950 [Candidatus Hermodarchaeota archaeon]